MRGPLSGFLIAIEDVVKSKTEEDSIAQAVSS